MFPESWTSSGCPEVRSLQWTAIDPWLEGSICYFIEPLLQTGSAHRLHDFPQGIFTGNCGIQNRPPLCHTGTVSSFNPLRRSHSTVLQRSSGKASGVPEHLWCGLLVVLLDLSMFCYYFGYPFVTSSNRHILWNNWTRAWMSHCAEGSRPVRGIILQRCGMNILSWNTKLPRRWKALIVLSLGDFHCVSFWLGFGSCRLYPYHLWSPPLSFLVCFL